MQPFLMKKNIEKCRTCVRTSALPHVVRPAMGINSGPSLSSWAGAFSKPPKWSQAGAFVIWTTPKREKGCPWGKE